MSDDAVTWEVIDLDSSNSVGFFDDEEEARSYWEELDETYGPVAFDVHGYAVGAWLH